MYNIYGWLMARMDVAILVDGRVHTFTLWGVLHWVSHLTPPITQGFGIGPPPLWVSLPALHLLVY